MPVVSGRIERTISRGIRERGASFSGAVRYARAAEWATLMDQTALAAWQALPASVQECAETRIRTGGDVNASVNNCEGGVPDRSLFRSPLVWLAGAGVVYMLLRR